MLLARGTTPKLISSTKGVKGGMQIIEEMVDRNLIPRKDFRASLIRVGKKYGIDFSGNDSMTSIKNDIEQKFMKPSDSTFAKRGSFFEDLISDISSTSAASKENIDGIRKFLGSKKRISFSKEGITSSIAELMTERMLIDLPSSHAYAVIEVDNDVKVEKSKKHDSYPYSIVQVDGKRPTLYLLKDRPKAVPSLLTKDGERATNAKVGFAQMGYGRAIVDPALAAEAEQQNKPIEGLFKESQSKRYKEGLQDSKISNQIEDKISNDPTWKQRERTQFERFIDLSRVKIQDKLFGAIKLQEDIEYAKERPVKLDEDFKNAEVLMHGKAEEDIKKTEELAVDIIKSIKDAGLDLQSFDDLLYAIHAQERNRYLRIQSTDIYNSIKKLREEANLKPSEVAEATGVLVEDYRKIEDGTIERGITNEELVNILSLFGKTPAQFFYENALSKNGSGMKDDQAQMILSAYGLDKYNPDINKLRPDIRDAIKKTYDITNDTRNRMLEFGLETQERIDTYNNTYKNYVPLRGFADDKYDSEIIGNGNGIEVRSKEKRAKGRESKADSPFAQIIAQNQAAIIRGRKNEVANRLYELAKNNPNPEIFEVIDPAVDKNYKKSVTPQGIRLTADTVFDYMKQPENFSVLVNGEYKFIKFADPRIADQLRNASVVKSDFIVKYIGWYSRLLSKLLTQYNPTFVLTNFFRDIQTAIVNSISEQEIEGGLLKGKNITFKIFKSTFPSIKAIFDVEFNRNANAEYAKYYKEFKEDGGKTGWFYSKSVDELKTDFERLINGKGQGVAKNAASIIERVNSSVENGVRLSAYIESRKAGLSREKAAELAKNLTINFNKSGSLGPSANALYLFFNASVQGTSRLIRTLKPQYRKNDDGSRSLYMTNAQKIMTSVFVFGGVMSIINELISDDDDDGKSFYSKIPEFEKERNIIFMNPDGKTYEKWPLPYGFNVFYVAGNAIGEASQGLKSSATVLGNIFEATVGSFSPINFPSSDEFSNWFFKFITPTFLQIPLAIQMNENYFGQTIYNENFPLDPTPKPDSELGRKGATPWSTAIAKGLNELTGGSEFRSGFRDINPDAIDFISETVLGGTGRFVSRSTSVLANLLTGNADKIEVNKIPIVSTFYGQPVKYTDLQDYFDKRIEVNQYMEEVRADKITGAEEDRIREMYKVSKAVDGALRNLRKAEKTAENIEDSERRENRLNDIERKRYAQITNFQKAYEKYKIDKL
jgi:transcriptional regulator with XRE-family HTH domain